MNDSDHDRPVRRLLLAWAALVALMLASLGSAYLPLGAGNLVAGVVIAAVKTGIVAWVFMRLARASGVVRLAAAAGLATWLLLASLASLDLATRPRDAAPVQPPRQLKASRAAGTPSAPFHSRLQYKEMPMARCDVCGNDYDKAFQLTKEGRTWTFDSFECAVQACAPACAHCSCKIIGHGVEAGGKMYCCAHCAQSAGVEGLRDRA